MINHWISPEFSDADHLGGWIIKTGVTTSNTLVDFCKFLVHGFTDSLLQAILGSISEVIRAHPRWLLWPVPSWTTKPTASSSTPAVQDLFWAIPQRSSYAKSDLDISMGPRTLQPKKWSMITYMITRNSVSVSVCMIYFHIFHDVIRQRFSV